MKTLVFAMNEYSALAELLAALQYHAVKFSVEKNGTDIHVIIN